MRDGIGAEPSELGWLAGISPAEQAESAGAWVQIGIAPARECWRQVYAVLFTLASQLLEDSSVSNFFYMNKPPGLRVRFQAGHDRRQALGAALRARIGGWQAEGIAERVTGGVYEPEQTLFGGPGSMRHVHRLFTVDAMAWLAFYGSAPCPPWAFSLAMISGLLDGLEIIDWEDLDVWERIRRQARRTVPAGLPADRVTAAVSGLQATWAERADFLASLPGDAAALVGKYRPLLEAAALEWSKEYFLGADASIGPREAAAFFTIFHWNRGGLPGTTQAIIAAALADRAGRQ